MAHHKTFEWLFQDSVRVDDQRTWSSFPSWLQKEDSSIYWITGKPGSGKSTIMKFIYHNPCLSALLSNWKQEKSMTIAGFYFWNSGSGLQMSFDGLLRTLLHTCFSEEKSLVQSVLRERWEEFVAFGGGQDPYHEAELLRTFEHVINDTARKFFFLIDGLDEFDGEPAKIIQFVLSAARPNIKMCVASRPWLPFEDAFEQRPSLLLERLTWNDIALYVTEKFTANAHYKRLKSCEPMAAGDLVPEIVGKACGVFLWVYLVVESLLVGLSNADRMSDLQARLRALPSDLETLFDVILNRLEPEYFRQACETFRLMRTYRETTPHATKHGESDVNPTLLGFYFADETESESSIEAACKRLDTVEALSRAEQMRRRLSARCKGLLEVQGALNPNKQLSFYDYTISYLHRTARDYVEYGDFWKTVLETSGDHSFAPEAKWANANLWLHKLHPTGRMSVQYSSHMTHKCLDSAIAVYCKTGIVQAKYLDEVFHVPVPLRGTGPGMIVDVHWWSELLRSHDSLLSYLMVLLACGPPADRDDAIHIAREIIKKDGTGRQPDSKTLKHLKKVLDYYSKRGHLRWLRRPPALPLYQ